MEIADEILGVHGVAPGRKAEGVTRVICEISLCYLSSTSSGEEKSESDVASSG